ncbi:MAG TPA: hypothetical protein GX529_06085 [Firmicutes bacterium]|nr:hypothetical protein [Candidatus Fermentithermobacillaceae bacterium]
MSFLHLALLVAVFALIAWHEVPAIVKKQQWRELTLFSVLMLSTLTLSILMLMKVSVPNPTKLTEALVRYLMEITSRLLP